jgi:hypothetical protein
VNFLKNLFESLWKLFKKKDSVGITDPVGDAIADCARLRALAINVHNGELQALVFSVCTELSKALSDAKRTPGRLTVLGPLLCVTKRQKESLELWLKLSRQPSTPEAEKEMAAVVELFRDLAKKYTELAKQVQTEDLDSLAIRVSAISGTLSADGKLPERTGSFRKTVAQ